MARPQTLLAAVVLTGFLGAQALPEDPVLKARAQRAQAQGVNPGDLPPVPRTVMEPPPLPAPELHSKDNRKASRAKGKKGATKAAIASKKSGKKAAAPKRSKKKR